jgi:peptidoglycan hydrolase-like protein with peptidoglycan-binding domain
MSSKPTRRLSRAVNTRAHVRTGMAAAVSAGLLLAAVPAAATATGGSLLSQGSTGSAVTQVQHALHVGATGRFDSGTKDAVLALQRKDGLQVDGIVGPQTEGALFGHSIGSSSSSASDSSGAASSSSSGTSGYSIPAGIVQCESGGNYSAVNSSSGAGGAYQILPSTWQAYGGQGLPQDAPKAEQDRIAGEIYAKQGPSAWVC